MNIHNYVNLHGHVFTFKTFFTLNSYYIFLVVIQIKVHVRTERNIIRNSLIIMLIVFGIGSQYHRFWHNLLVNQQ